MEIKTCEEYVLNRAKELENDVFRLKEELEAKNKQIKELEDIVTTYDELFREQGSKDVFDSSNHVSVNVCEAYEDEREYYNFLISRNGQFLKVKDYRTKSDENSQEDEE